MKIQDIVKIAALTLMAAPLMPIRANANPGDIYVSYNGHAAIRGTIYDYAPNGIGRVFASRLNGPRGITFDGAGNLLRRLVMPAQSSNLHRMARKAPSLADWVFLRGWASTAAAISMWWILAARSTKSRRMARLARSSPSPAHSSAALLSMEQTMFMWPTLPRGSSTNLLEH